MLLKIDKMQDKLFARQMNFGGPGGPSLAFTATLGAYLIQQNSKTCKTNWFLFFARDLCHYQRAFQRPFQRASPPKSFNLDVVLNKHIKA